MRIAVTSDIHLEFAHWEPVNPDNADVLILSGDILLAGEIEKALGDPQKIIDGNGHRFLDFLISCKQNYTHVIYIMGNHEHYHGDFVTTSKILKTFCDNVGIHFLDKDCVTIDDVTFIGGTLWTDMNKEDGLTLYHVQKMMNDFRCVKNSNKQVSFKTFDSLDKPGSVTDEEWNALPYEQKHKAAFHTRPAKFSPEDAVEDHKKMLQYISIVVREKPQQKFVVVGHHAPSKLSTKPQYENDTLMNGAYSSDLSEFILDHPQIKVWTHGHTHHNFDYMVGSTRVVCNPRGYVGYERGTDKEDPYFAQVVEV